MRLAIAALLLAFGATAAHAEDWSAFIDHNPQKPLVSKPAPVVVNASKSHSTRVAKVTRTRSKSKAKAKAKARTKSRRR
jgi:hypothetical protein